MYIQSIMCNLCSAVYAVFPAPLGGVLPSRSRRLAFVALLAMLASSSAGDTQPASDSQDSAPAIAPGEAEPQPAHPPAPQYSGDPWERSTLTGDWGGSRNELAQKGITLDMYLTQIYQGVIEGGMDKGWQYGGRENVALHFDMGRMGILPGGSVMLEGEGNYGEFVGTPQTGTVLPANSNLLFPNTDGPQFNLSQVLYMQFLSHHMGFFIGKIDATSGDANAFAHSKGDRQFLNTAFAFNPIISVAAPAYALGAGIVILPTGNPHEFIITASIMDMEGQSSTSGFDTVFEGGTSFTGEARYTTHFFNLTGHQLLGGMYSDRLYTSVDQNLRNFIIPGLPIQKSSGAWAVYYNFDQYLYQPDANVNRGLGIFGRFGISDGEANPVHYFGSVGVGGKGLIPGRENDQFGIGFFRLCPSDSPALDTLGFRESEGFEAYYEIAITPSVLLTPDVQVIKPSQENVDTSTLLGVRLTV